MALIEMTKEAEQGERELLAQRSNLRPASEPANTHAKPNLYWDFDQVALFDRRV
jgi:hypothetical protein